MTMSRAFKKIYGLGPWRKGPDLAAALQMHGVEAFNRARSRSIQWQPNFAGADLNGLDLSYANLRNAKLVNASLDGVIIDNLALDGERAKISLARRGAIVE
ncbi:MAG: pentapeptide repeat-containing protein [Anaerolineae bacterium]|nr:pentapeptide repeat-containing protein [Anaerolineae bacterium]